MRHRVGVDRLVRSAVMLPVCLLISIETERTGRKRASDLVFIDGAQRPCRTKRRSTADAQFENVKTGHLDYTHSP